MTRINSHPATPPARTFAPDLDDRFTLPTTRRNVPLPLPLPLCHGGSPFRPRPPLTPIGGIIFNPKPPTTPPPTTPPPTTPPITGYTPHLRHVPPRDWIPVGGTPVQSPPQIDFTRNALERLAPLRQRDTAARPTTNDV